MNISIIMPFLNENKNEIKVHCAIGREDKLEPLYKFSSKKFKQWQESQNGKNFERKYILSLIYIQSKQWLFAGVYESIDVKKTEDNKYIYKTKLLKFADELIGKLVIEFDKTFRQSYLLLENYLEYFNIYEIKNKIIQFEKFPGYNNVFIKFELLKEIMNESEETWKTALSNIKGVYLITDILSGKLYVGSAYGSEAIWNRWKNYIDDGHGGNKLLKEVILKNNYEYAFNYSFSILEIFGLNATDDEIIDKESLWKEKLMTRKNGYNKN